MPPPPLNTLLSNTSRKVFGAPSSEDFLVLI